MWHNRKKLFLTRNPNYVITAIGYFPNMNTSIALYKENTDIVRLQEDKKYRNIIAYYELFHGGHDIIPLYFADDNVKIAKLDKLYPQGRSYFWCLAYVSDCLKDKNKAILHGYNSLAIPSLETLLGWLKYYSKNYCNDTSSRINRCLAQDYLKKWIIDNSNDKISYDRRFKLIYNCSTIFEMNKELTVEDWITHLENLPNRDFYEIIVNDFE
jgi:hypothetical protein